MNAEENEPRVDSSVDAESSPSSNAKVAKDETKRVKGSDGTKRSGKALATVVAEPDAEAELAAAVTRAEEIMDRAGERVGQLFRSGERVGQFLRAGGQQLKQQRTLATDADKPSTDPQAEADLAPAVARAEEIMDRAGERVGQLLRAGGHQVHRTTELAREAVEDFWAEAESIRRGERSSSN